MHDQVRRDLTAAMRRRDKVAVSALRSLLSALANAEAVEHQEPTPSAGLSQSSEHVAGASIGVGSADVERRRLSDAERDDVVRHEVVERRQAASQLAAAGQEERAHRLLEEADVLSAYLSAVRGSGSLCRPDAGA